MPLPVLRRVPPIPRLSLPRQTQSTTNRSAPRQSPTLCLRIVMRSPSCEPRWPSSDKTPTPSFGICRQVWRGWERKAGSCVLSWPAPQGQPSRAHPPGWCQLTRGWLTIPTTTPTRRQMRNSSLIMRRCSSGNSSRRIGRSRRGGKDTVNSNGGI